MAILIDREREEFIKGLWRDNPVFRQVLGMCPMLAVTNTAINSVAMGGATMFTLVGASFFVSVFKSFIPHQVRISTFVIIIATFVTIADYSLQAISPGVHKSLGAFVFLIVANCMILSRLDVFSVNHTVKLALLDSVGMSTGFTLALVLLGAVREVLGSGSLFGIGLFGPHFEPWVIMVLPPGGYITLGVMLLVFNWISFKRKKFLKEVADVEQRDT